MLSTAVLLLALAANPHLDEGRKLYEQLKYPEAEARLKIAAESPNNSAAEQAQIADLLARAMIAQGRSTDAERVYSELLAKQSDAPDPAGASPKIREVFNRAKRTVYPEGFVRLQRAPSAAGRLEVELIDPWRRVRSLQLAIAKPGAWETQPMRLEARHAGAELAPPPGATWRCAVEALDEDGKVVASLATRDAPLIFEALPAKVTTAAPEVHLEGPKGPTRWPALLTGVLALGAMGAGTGLAISSAHDYGQVMPMTPATLTRSLDDSARTKALAAWLTFGGALLMTALCAVLIWNW